MSSRKKVDKANGEAAAGAARPSYESGAAPAAGVGDGKPQRFSAKRKLQAVQRLIAGECLEAIYATER